MNRVYEYTNTNTVTSIRVQFCSNMLLCCFFGLQATRLHLVNS